jgi:ABC-2 type transport system permease protein
MPLGKGDFILGYALAFGFLAIFQTAIAVSFAVWVCGLEIEGSIWLLFAVAVADALLGTAFGLLASAFARTEFQVVQFMPLLVFPQILLGGIFIPRDQLPEGLEIISDWLPLSYAIEALQAVAGDTESTEWIMARLLAIGAWIVGSIVVGSITLRRRTP